MSESDLFEGIDDYLVGLADGIHQAQKRLNELRLTGDPSQPPTTYFMPKVEFELKMAFELSRRGGGAAAGQGGGGAPLPPMTARRGGGPLAKRMKMRPLGAGGGGGSLNESAASVIRGSFVAVPAAGGQPAPRLATRLLAAAGETPPQVEVSVSDALGKPLAGVTVNFNLDHGRGLEMNRLEGLEHEPGEHNEMVPGVVTTDERGLARAQLRVDAAEPAGCNLVVVVDVEGESEELVYEVLGRG